MNIIFSNLNKNPKIKKSKVINMKCFEKNRELIPFLEVWSRDVDENGRFLRETLWVCERDEQTRQWTVKVSKRKTEKFLKTVLKAQNMRFSWMKLVANKSPKTLETKFEKFV